MYDKQWEWLRMLRVLVTYDENREDGVMKRVSKCSWDWESMRE